MTDDNDKLVDYLRPYMIPVIELVVPAGPKADYLHEINRQCALAYRDRQARRKAEAELADLRAQLDQCQDEQPERPTADDILARFYQARAKNPKIMLSKFLRSIGESDRENYIRKRKVVFDRQRKRSKLG